MGKKEETKKFCPNMPGETATILSTPNMTRWICVGYRGKQHPPQRIQLDMSEHGPWAIRVGVCSKCWHRFISFVYVGG